MNGNEIAGMRLILNWSREDFGQLIGASSSAVFRWENGAPTKLAADPEAPPDAPKFQRGDPAVTTHLDPRFRVILGVLKDVLDRDVEKARLHLESVRRQGAVRGLYVLLGLYYDAARYTPETDTHVRAALEALINAADPMSDAVLAARQLLADPAIDGDLPWRSEPLPPDAK